MWQVGTPSGRPKYDVLITNCGIVEGFDFALNVDDEGSGSGDD